MIYYSKIRRTSFIHRLMSAFVAFTFVFASIITPSYAQSLMNLPVPGTMVMQSPAFVPVLLKGMTIHPEDPFRFDFIVDSGNTDFAQDEIKKESEKLVKYFLASMTIPKDDLWVNLSPYESDRIIPDELGKTELGRDMLAQDYILKQLTASLMYPEDELGSEFWRRVYKKAEEQFGTSEIPVNTFNKVWIMPESATVYENDKTVYVVESRLKVLLDEDYLAMQENKENAEIGADQLSEAQIKNSSSIFSQIVREIILPEIEKEVNEGKNFATLRQIYHSLILAKWYKETIKNSLLSQVYIDQKKTSGVELDDKTIKEQIYDQYMRAYKKGVFDFIKEDYDQLSQEVIPRKYFSGGEKFKEIPLKKAAEADNFDAAMVGDNFQLSMRINLQNKGNDEAIDAELMKKHYIPGQVKQTPKALGGFLYNNFEYGFIKWGETELVVRLKGDRWDLERDQWVVAQGAQLKEDYKNEVDGLFKDSQARTEMTTEQMYAKIISLRQKYYANEVSAYEKRLQDFLRASGVQVVGLLRNKELSLKDALRVAILSDYGNNIYEQLMGADRQGFDDAVFQRWLEDLPAVDDIDRFIRNIKDKDYVHIVGSVNSLAADLEIFAKRLLSDKDGARSIIFVVKDMRVGMDATKADIDTLLSMDEFKALKNDPRFKVVVSGSEAPGTDFTKATPEFQNFLRKIQEGSAVLGLKGELNNHTADFIPYDHYRFLLSRMIDTRRKMGIFWNIDEHQAPPIIALRVPSGIATSDRWGKSIYVSHFLEARDWFEAQGWRYTDIKQKMLTEGLHFVEAAYPEALVAPIKMSDFQVEYALAKKADPGLTIVGFARQKRLELMNEYASKVIGSEYTGNIYSLDGDGKSANVGAPIRGLTTGKTKVLVNGGVFDLKKWSVGVIRAGAVTRAYDVDSSRELLAHEYVFGKMPNAQVTFNGLYFFTPTLLEIYNRYRINAGRSDEIIRDVNFYLDAYSQDSVETLPLYNKGYFGMRDGNLVFGQRRLLGGEMSFGDKKIRWTKDNVVDSKEKIVMNNEPVLVFTPMLGDSVAEGEASIRDNGYFKLVGEDRINLVVVNNQIKFIKKGSVLLPSMGVVISLKEDTFSENFPSITLGLEAYSKDLPPVAFNLNWLDGEDRPDWYFGGGTLIYRNGKNLVANKKDEYDNLKAEGWFNKLSMQTQETQVQDWVRGPRMILGITKSGKAFSYAFSGRSETYAGTNFGEAIAIISQELQQHEEEIQDAINLDGGSSVSFNVRGDNNKAVTLSWPATGPDNIEGVVRPVSNIVYLMSENADRAMQSGNAVLGITDSRSAQISLVGGKAASLKELASVPGVSVPDGFSVTTEVYADYLEKIGADEDIENLEQLSERWKGLQEHDPEREVLIKKMRVLSEKIQALILNGSIPVETQDIILDSYRKLEKDGKPALVAVRSSATAEDMPGASFAGQYKTLLNQQGDDQVIEAIKKVWASTYNMNAIEYRNKQNMQHSKNKMCALILEMINPQSAGTAFSVDLETGMPYISINNSYGLGEAEVSGIVTSDTWIVDPNTGVIIKRRLGEKGQKIIYDLETKQNITVDVAPVDRKKYAISKEMAREIALLVKRIQDHYVGKSPNLNHMDVEYAITYDGRIVFTQARPETVWTSGEHALIAIDAKAVEKKNKEAVKSGKVSLYPEIFKGGVSGSAGVARGILHVVSTVAEAEDIVRPGDIMVAPNTTNAWEHVMGRTSGIITEIGGPGNHTAVVSREQKKAAIVGAVGAMQNLKVYEGQMVTVDATSKRVYLNAVPVEFEYAPDKVSPIYGDRFAQTLEQSWEEAQDTMTTTADPNGTRWINKPNQSVRLFLQQVFTRSHQWVAEQLNPGHHFRDRINKEGKYQVNFDDIFPWMERLADKPLEGPNSLSAIHEDRVKNIRDFLNKSENLTLTTESIKGWLDSFITLNAYMGFAYNIYRITEGLLQDALKREQIPEPYLSQIWLSMSAWVGETEAVERNRDYGRLLEEVKAAGVLRNDLKAAIEEGQKFDVFAAKHPQFYGVFNEHAFNYKIIKNTDDIFASAPFHYQLAKELLKDASDNRTITIYNTKPEQFFPDDPEFTRIARLAFFASKLRQDAHHFKVRGQWKFVEVLKPLAAFLIKKGQIKAFGEIFDHTPEWILEKVGEYEHAGIPTTATKPLFHIKPYEIQNLEVDEDMQENDDFDAAMLTSMGRWQFDSVQWDENSGRLTLVNAKRIEGTVKPEFLEKGQHSPRDIILSARKMTDRENSEVESLATTMGMDVNKIFVINLDQVVAFNRIYGLYSDGNYFIREDVLSEGTQDQIHEALDHLRLKPTGLGYEELKKIQYYGNLRGLITKLSHKTIKTKLLFKLYGELEASKIVNSREADSIKNAIMKAILDQLGDKQGEYWEQLDRFQTDELFYDQVSREMIRNDTGFIEALGIVNKMNADSVDSSMVSSPGGIDMNNIDVNRQGSGVDIQFDPAMMQDILNNGIDGFVPVIINLTPINSIMPLLGLEPKNREEEYKVSSLN